MCLFPHSPFCISPISRGTNILTLLPQEDSVLLWKAICSNKLLAKVDLVLFLNKCDILAAKLNSGIRLAKYVRSFGERPNDSETAEKCELSGFCPHSNSAMGSR